MINEPKQTFHNYKLTKPPIVVSELHYEKKEKKTGREMTKNVDRRPTFLSELVHAPTIQPQMSNPSLMLRSLS